MNPHLQIIGVQGRWTVKRKLPRTLVLRQLPSEAAELRAALGMTNSQFAKALRVTPNISSAVCAGKQPSRGVAVRLQLLKQKHEGKTKMEYENMTDEQKLAELARLQAAYTDKVAEVAELDRQIKELQCKETA